MGADPTPAVLGTEEEAVMLLVLLVWMVAMVLVVVPSGVVT